MKPSPANPPAAPVYDGPRSGRIIWTGALGRRGVVEIDGAHATVGSLSGALPGVPLALHISPAEFSRDGLTVFTRDRAKAGQSEKPGRSNGWNSLTFRLDPLRAGQLAVLEAPSQSNDFKRLVLRSDAAACSVIVIDWAVR
jgi:hypothetical protein